MAVLKLVTEKTVGGEHQSPVTAAPPATPDPLHSRRLVAAAVTHRKYDAMNGIHHRNPHLCDPPRVRAYSLQADRHTVVSEGDDGTCGCQWS